MGSEFGQASSPVATVYEKVVELGLSSYSVEAGGGRGEGTTATAMVGS